MRVRAGRGQAELVKAYAEANEISLRTAQRHRSGNAPAWEEFVKGRAVAAVRTSAPAQVEEAIDGAAELLIETDLLPEGLSPEEAMEAAALKTWQAIKEFQNHAIAAKDLALAASLAKPEMDAQESYRKARKAREAAQVAAGALIPAGAMGPVKKALEGVARLLNGAPMELGPRVNPPDAAFATEAVREWLRDRFNPQLAEVVKELRALAPDPSPDPEPEGEVLEAEAA